MDFLLFNDVSLLPKSGIGHLCENLNSILDTDSGMMNIKYRIRSG
jgi:hypothetical protein